MLNRIALTMDLPKASALTPAWIVPGLSIGLLLVLRCAQLYLTATLVLSTRKDSIWRAASIPLHLSLGCLQFMILIRDVVQQTLPLFVRGLLAAITFFASIWSLTVLFALALEREDIAKLSQSSTIPDQRQWLVKFAGNLRALGTPYQITRIPSFDRARPSYMPSPSEAIWCKANQILICYLVRDVMLTVAWNRIPDGLFWLLYNRFYLDMIASFFSAAGLIYGDRVENHPPDFGSLGATNSIRGFWGNFWHQNLRFNFTSLSSYICKNIFGFDGLIQRYLNIWTVFTFSAAMHLCCDRATGVQWDESGAVKFFLSQPVGIMIEDAISVMWLRLPSARFEKRYQWLLLGRKMICYVWTWAFVGFTAGWYMAPYKSQFLEVNAVPISILKPILLLYGGASGDNSREL